MWSIRHGNLQYFVTLCQLFGGKSPPLNFARYAAWLCECAAALFGLPLSHCVDAIISVEPTFWATFGNLTFKILCSLMVGLRRRASLLHHLNVSWSLACPWISPEHRCQRQSCRSPKSGWSSLQRFSRISSDRANPRRLPAIWFIVRMLWKVRQSKTAAVH